MALPGGPVLLRRVNVPVFLSSATSLLSPSTNEGSSPHPELPRSRVSLISDVTKWLSTHPNERITRRVGKVDRFSVFALEVTEKHIGLAQSRYPRAEVGVVVGNMLAG